MARFYEVPAGTERSQCNGSTCRGVVYWIDDDGRRVPVDCDVDGGEAPSETADTRQRDMFAASVFIHAGRGVHHMTVCPDAKQFRR